MSGEEWKRIALYHAVRICRGGWLGVWDALIAAVTGEPRTTVVQGITFSVYAKRGSSRDIRLGIAQGCVEKIGVNNKELLL